MSIFEILMVGVGLSMDAVAVSTVSGMSIQNIRLREALAIAIAFGLFQGIMPLLGFFAGSVFADFMSAYAPWIALVLLVAVGGKMIWESFTAKEEKGLMGICFKLLLAQAVATSIDALAIGVGFAAVQVNIVSAAFIIACTTFLLSWLAVYIGKACGNFLAGKAELVGGVILVVIGIKMVL